MMENLSKIILLGALCTVLMLIIGDDFRRGSNNRRAQAVPIFESSELDLDAASDDTLNGSPLENVPEQGSNSIEDSIMKVKRVLAHPGQNMARGATAEAAAAITSNENDDDDDNDEDDDNDCDDDDDCNDRDDDTNKAKTNVGQQQQASAPKQPQEQLVQQAAQKQHQAAVNAAVAAIGGAGPKQQVTQPVGSGGSSAQDAGDLPRILKGWGLGAGSWILG